MESGRFTWRSLSMKKNSGSGPLQQRKTPGKMAHGDKTSWQRTNILVGGHVALSTSTPPRRAALDPPRSNWRASTSPRPLLCGEDHVLDPLRCAWWRWTCQTPTCERKLLLTSAVGKTTFWVSASTSANGRLRKLMESKERKWGLSLLGHENCKGETWEWRRHWRWRQSSQGTDVWEIAPPSASGTETTLSGWGTLHEWMQRRVAPWADAFILEPNSAARTITTHEESVHTDASWDSASCNVPTHPVLSFLKSPLENMFFELLRKSSQALCRALQLAEK